MPFANDYQKQLHFQSHGKEFSNCASANDYERLADGFMAVTGVPDIRECFRPDGSRVRFRKATKELGVSSKNGVIHTYFRAKDKYILQAFFKYQCGGVWHPQTGTS